MPTKRCPATRVTSPHETLDAELVQLARRVIGTVYAELGLAGVGDPRYMRGALEDLAKARLGRDGLSSAEVYWAFLVAADSVFETVH